MLCTKCGSYAPIGWLVPWPLSTSWLRCRMLYFHSVRKLYVWMYSSLSTDSSVLMVMDSILGVMQPMYIVLWTNLQCWLFNAITCANPWSSFCTIGCRSVCPLLTFAPWLAVQTDHGFGGWFLMRVRTPIMLHNSASEFVLPRKLNLRCRLNTLQWAMADTTKTRPLHTAWVLVMST